jgi:hypothetical protein
VRASLTPPIESPVTARTGILIARTGEPARPNVLICTVAGQSKLDPTAAPNEYLRTGRPPVSVTDRDPIFGPALPVLENVLR